jgi:hypothetical protein
MPSFAISSTSAFAMRSFADCRGMDPIARDLLHHEVGGLDRMTADAVHRADGRGIAAHHANRRAGAIGVV